MLQSIINRYENEILTQKVQIYANQIETILQSEKRVKALKHNLKHYINELGLLAKKHELQDMEEYINRMQLSMQNPDEIVKSGNIEVDGVLDYMLEKAKTELKEVNVRVQLPEKIAHSFDIVVVLGNLLEKAIEVASKTVEKYLYIHVIYKQGVLNIEIKNSYLPTEVIDDYIIKKQFVTTKQNKNDHGIGLSSVQRIVEKYNGIMNIECHENVFRVQAMLYLEYTV